MNERIPGRTDNHPEPVEEINDNKKKMINVLFNTTSDVY